MSTPLIIQNLEKNFSYQPVLRGIDLTCSSHQCTLVLGGNGSGKSTLLNILAGLLTPNQGTVSYQEQEQSINPNFFRKKTGYLLHRSMFYEDLSIMDNLQFTLGLYAKKRSTSDIENVLRELKLLAFLDTSIRVFSEGMKQRLAVARLMLLDADILLLDEPFSGLDPYFFQVLFDYLEAQKKKGKIIILVSHQVEKVFPLSDQFCILHQGKTKTHSKVTMKSREELLSLYQKYLT